MKKYVIAGAFVLVALSTAVANEVNNTTPKAVVIVTADEFKKVTSKELTPPVVEELLKEYPTSKLGGVFKNDSGEFKLIMVLKSGTRRTVYIDQYGNWLNKR